MSGYPVGIKTTPRSFTSKQPVFPKKEGQPTGDSWNFLLRLREPESGKADTSKRKK